MLVDLTDHPLAERHLGGSETRYRAIFDHARISVWEQDFSEVVAMLQTIRSEGVTDLRSYFQARPAALLQAIDRVRLIDVNAFTIEMFEADSKEALLNARSDIFLSETAPIFIEELVTLWEGRRDFAGDAVVQTLKGRRIDLAFTMAFEGESCERALVTMLDISTQKAAERSLQQQKHRLETLNRLAKVISSDLDLERIIKTATDAATELSGAEFGAFFYKVIDEKGERYTLYSLSGAPTSAFETFGLPHDTAVFDPIFRGTGIIRSDDVRSDPRYGQGAPLFGMPKGLLPVVSYLAVPVVSRAGEVHGGLFFGHDQAGIFSAESEETVAAIATHAAIAIDNVRLIQAAEFEIKQRSRAEKAAQHLAAIVESSDDAILAKDLDGTITSWNRGAERLFGYTAEEAIGKPVTMLVPVEHDDAQPANLARIRRGEAVNPYETVRQHKDGSRVEIALTTAPIKDAGGAIVGTSKIARDITERIRGEEQQIFLLQEMDHRVNNLFAVSSAVVSLSAHSAGTVKELAAAAHDRLEALARAHALTMPKMLGGDQALVSSTTLHALIHTIAAPYGEQAGIGRARVAVSGVDVPISGGSVTRFALLLNEFATNAAKYGALSTPDGHLKIECSEYGDYFLVKWMERGGPRVDGDGTVAEGFGSVLTRATVTSHLGGEIAHHWGLEGLTIHLLVDPERLTGS
jgi:PAS domain S-box-containing protein